MVLSHARVCVYMASLSACCALLCAPSAEPHCLTQWHEVVSGRRYSIRRTLCGWRILTAVLRHGWGAQWARIPGMGAPAREAPRVFPNPPCPPIPNPWPSAPSFDYCFACGLTAPHAPCCDAAGCGEQMLRLALLLVTLMGAQHLARQRQLPVGKGCCRPRG